MSAGREKPEVQLAQAMVSLCPLRHPSAFLSCSVLDTCLHGAPLRLCFLLPLGGSTEHAFP